MPIHDKAFYIALFFLLGLAAVNFGFSLWIAFVLSLFLSKFFFSLENKYIAVILIITFTGFFYVQLFKSFNKDNISLNKLDVYSGLITTQPREEIKHTILEVDLYHPHKGEIRLYTSPDREYYYGDIISFTGEIRRSSSGNINISSFPEVEILERGRGSAIKSSLFQFKQALVSNLEAVLPVDKSALMAGILLGERAEFSDEFEEAMRNSGTTHIVALSGYNVAILAVIVNTLFARFWGRRRSFYLSMLLIPAFVIMTGAEASVVRAGIMAMILLLAEQQGRTYSFRNAIVLTAFFMLLIDPFAISNDVGFQLSFAALLGLVYIHPWLAKKLKVLDDGFLSWKKNALQTTSAQIAVLPIIVTTFGFFSPTALISNVLILEVIPLTMLMGFLTSILGFVSFHLSLIVGWATNLLLSYEILVINLFGFNWF